MDDHELASFLAEKAGSELLKLRDDGIASGMNSWVLRDKGDSFAHNIIINELTNHRPQDAVLSEEGADDLNRIQANRIWIVDPLDGSQDYPYAGSEEWAVHIARSGFLSLIEEALLNCNVVPKRAIRIRFKAGD